MRSSCQAGCMNQRPAVQQRTTGFYSSQNNRRRPVPILPGSGSAGSGRVDDCTYSHNDFLKGATPAMAYVPWQHWQNIYEPCRAFGHGTIFEDLDMPFLGKGGRRP